MRTAVSNNGTFIKKAETAEEEQAITNEWRFLQALQDTGIAPYPVDCGTDFIEMEYIQSDTTPPNSEYLRTMATRGLLLLLKRNIIHSSLTDNFIIRKSIPVYVNWGYSRFAWEDNGFGGLNAASLYPALWHKTRDEYLSRWCVLNYHIARLRGYGTLWDLNMGRGDFVAFARSEGFNATGFSTDNTAIERAKSLWGEFGCQFYYRNIPDVGQYSADVILMINNTWDTLLYKFDTELVSNFINNLIKHAGVIYLETGVEDVSGMYNYLRKFTYYVKPLSLTTRGIERVLWQIKS